MKKIKAKLGIMLLKATIRFLEWGNKNFPYDFNDEDKNDLNACYSYLSKFKEDLKDC